MHCLYKNNLLVRPEEINKINYLFLLSELFRSSVLYFRSESGLMLLKFAVTSVTYLVHMRNVPPLAIGMQNIKYSK